MSTRILTAAERNSLREHVLRVLEDPKELSHPWVDYVNSLLDHVIKLLDEVETLRGEAQAIIDSVEADERFHYPPAAVDINAPLALEQVAMGAKRGAAQRILNACK